MLILVVGLLLKNEQRACSVLPRLLAHASATVLCYHLA
eukprot:COSAG06_NODE_53646_length_299_cov_0.520000_2_plen_37_part_01